MMTIEFDKDWCLRMAELEGNIEIGAGVWDSESYLRAYAKANGLKFPDKDD